MGQPVVSTPRMLIATNFQRCAFAAVKFEGLLRDGYASIVRAGGVECTAIKAAWASKALFALDAAADWSPNPILHFYLAYNLEIYQNIMSYPRATQASALGTLRTERPVLGRSRGRRAAIK